MCVRTSLIALLVASGAALLVAQGLDDEYAPAAVQFTASASPLENMTASAGGALPVSGKLLQLILPAGFARGEGTAAAAETAAAVGSALVAVAAVLMALMTLTVAVLLLGALAGLFGPSVTAAISDTVRFWRALYYYAGTSGAYADCPVFTSPEDRRVRVYVHSLALILRLWNEPHYRSGTFANDMRKNLRNVALPGTGVPLSWLCVSRPLFAVFLALGVPVVSLAYSLFLAPRRRPAAVADTYRGLLLRPEPWFFYWRLNCRLASYHALLTQAKGYRMEDKWTFLQEARAAGVPISPYLDMPAIVVKDRNEEGGMGIHFYANAAREGGRWIIQPVLANDARVQKWLTPDAPLSTMRVITASDNALDLARTGAMAPGEAERLAKVRSLSAVFRAGRAGASTDHSSILFDVDRRSGLIGQGTTNAHWYQLGLGKHVGRYSPAPAVNVHPDSGVTMTGERFEDMPEIRALVEEAHATLLPDVPLCGWDVAMTAEEGRCLLEVNLSCNFFNGSFDRVAYFDMMDAYFAALDAKARAMAAAGTAKAPAEKKAA